MDARELIFENLERKKIPDGTKSFLEEVQKRISSRSIPLDSADRDLIVKYIDERMVKEITESGNEYLKRHRTKDLMDFIAFIRTCGG